MFPFAASVPHPVAHALPVRLQLTARLGLPEPATCAVNASLAPVATVALVGEIDTWISLWIVIVAVALALESAWLVAVMVTLGADGKTEGAV